MSIWAVGETTAGTGKFAALPSGTGKARFEGRPRGDLFGEAGALTPPLFAGERGE